jgi:hypothetical protein
MKAVNSNSQTMLAKLLAKENIDVVVGNYNTAFFDIKSRTLGLPTWNSTNKGVSDLLVGHEVGHALHTPSDAIEKFRKHIPGAPFDIGNIVEDIRIERLVRDNYPGLVYSFNEGYKYFIENDFFKIKNLVVGNLKFIDRLNLRGKIGALIQVPMNKEEEAIYSRCLAAETYDDVLDICKDVYDLVKKEKEKEKEDQEDDSDSEQKQNNQDSEEQIASPEPADDENDDSENDKQTKGLNDTKNEGQDDSEDDTDGKGQDDSEDDTDGKGQEEGASQKTPPPSADQDEKDDSADSDTQDELNSKIIDGLNSMTQNEFDSNLKSLQKEMNYQVVNSPTKEQTMNCVVPIDTIMKARQASPHYNYAMTNPEFINDFIDFKSKTKKHIAVLIKEFERRKSAFQYSRSRQSDSGSINVNKLHSYKFEDQIFKSVTTLADAKSHGMVFFIDYSGSMRYTLEDVVNQTLQLVYFCKAVGIPFEVYGFTGPDDLQYNKPRIKTTFGLHITLQDRAHVFELLNSSMKKDKFELSVRELKAQLFNFNKNALSRFNMNTGYERMCSTPLLEAIIIAHDIVKNFKTKNRIQKMNTVFLTDGDGSKVNVMDVATDINYRKPVSGAAPGDFTRNKNFKINIHGREIDFEQNPYGYGTMPKQMYLDLIENLKITCGTTAIGFFIGQNQKDIKTTGIDAFRYNSKNKKDVSWAEGMESFKTEVKKNKKEKCTLVTGAFGYDAYFIFEGSKNLNIDNDDTFESETLKEGKSFNEASAQNKLAKDFTKFTSEKRNSRVFLSKFAEIIA